MSQKGLPVIFGVVKIAPIVLVAFPILAVSAGGQHNYVVVVVQVEQGISGLRPWSIYIPKFTSTW